MPQEPDNFREFGLLPEDAVAPAGPIRATFSTGQLIGQFAGTFIMSGLGLGIFAVMLLAFPFPANIGPALLPLGLFGFIVYRATRNDYQWVELDGDTIRAKHLYTRQLIERPVQEIDHLLTLVFLVRSGTTLLSEAWLGRVRGFAIRFRDGKSPFQVSRADPAMQNAQTLMEGLIYRMSEAAPIEAEIIQFGGAPLVRRIYWKEAPNNQP